MENNCTLLVGLHDDRGDGRDVQELKLALESARDEDKVSAMKEVIGRMIKGEDMSELLMHVIRFVTKTSNHFLKKLVMVYWECVDKKGPDGKLRPEMILVCNALINDLNHPNEFVRGCTLRLCTKLRERQVLEPLIGAVTGNLEHRNSYVRRNAVLAVFAIYKSFPDLIPDSPSLVANLLSTEGDVTTKRNAFLMLFHCDQAKAIAYMQEAMDQVPSMGDGFQLVVLELTRTLCRLHPEDKSRYIKCIITLLETASDSVLFECANTLVSVSNAPTAIRAAASCYTQLLRSQSDTPVKMVLLERLASLKDKHITVMQENVPELLRSLQSPVLEVQRLALALVLDLTTEGSVDEVVLTLRKELVKHTQSSAPEAEKTRLLFIQALRKCSTSFPATAPTILTVLEDTLGDDSNVCAQEALLCFRDAATQQPALRGSVFDALVRSLDNLQLPGASRGVLGLLGQFANSEEQIVRAMEGIRAVLGPLPLYTPPVEGAEEKKGEGEHLPQAKKESGGGASLLAADGTYKTQSAVEHEHVVEKVVSLHPLRELIVAGEYLVACGLANCLTKFCLRAPALPLSAAATNRLRSECMLIVVSMLRLGNAPNTPHPIDKNSAGRLGVCLRAMTSSSPLTAKAFTHASLRSLQDSVADALAEHKKGGKGEENKEVAVGVDEQITFRHLKANAGVMSQLDIEDQEFGDLRKAAGRGADASSQSFLSLINRTLQLSGYSDPVFVEGRMTLSHYDIVLEFTVTNTTHDRMENLMVDLAVPGDMRVCEQPQQHTLAPGATISIKASIKVASTQSGLIHGTVSYEANEEERTVSLASIKMDVMDYLTEGECTEAEFRTLWTEFEWENKILVNTKLSDPLAFLERIQQLTKCKCLTPASALQGNCAFVSANLVTKSVFGEFALLNVSLERSGGKLSGYVRVRTSDQGIAVGLGDRINLNQ